MKWGANFSKKNSNKSEFLDEYFKNKTAIQYQLLYNMKYLHNKIIKTTLS